MSKLKEFIVIDYNNGHFTEYDVVELNEEREITQSIINKELLKVPGALRSGATGYDLAQKFGGSIFQLGEEIPKEFKHLPVFTGISGNY